MAINYNAGWKHLIKVGINSGVQGNTVPETIWEPGGLYQFLPTSQTLEILSSSASDTALGVGARTVTISGLDVNWNIQSETVTLNGVTPVVTSLSWWRINSMIVASAGTNTTNVGNITLRRLGGGITQEYIVAGIGIARSLIYSVPAGHDLLLTSIVFSSLDSFTTNNAVLLRSRVRNSLTGVTFFPVDVKIMVALQPPYKHDAHPQVMFTEKTDYSWEAYESSLNAARGIEIYLSACLVNRAFSGTLDTTEYPRWP